MKGYTFYDPRQAHAYLAECILLYKGEPIVITKVSSNRGVLKAHYIALEEYTAIDREDLADTVNVYDDNLSLRPCPSGFINYPRVAAALLQAPVRIMKIGTHPNSILWHTYGHRLNPTLYHPAVAATFKQQYPSFEECLDYMANPQAKHRAFAYDLSLLKKGDVLYVQFLYSEATIGGVKNNKLFLLPDYEYLKETLTERKIPFVFHGNPLPLEAPLETTAEHLDPDNIFIPQPLEWRRDVQDNDWLVIRQEQLRRAAQLAQLRFGPDPHRLGPGGRDEEVRPLPAGAVNVQLAEEIEALVMAQNNLRGVDQP